MCVEKLNLISLRDDGKWRLLEELLHLFLCLFFCPVFFVILTRLELQTLVFSL